MLNRFHLILEAGHPARISSILKAEHFDHQFAKLETPAGSFDAVVVTCVDFHDIGIVLDKLSDYTSLSSYFVDGNNVVFQYSKIDRTITSLGHVYPGNIDSYNHTLTIGSKSYSFWSE